MRNKLKYSKSLVVLLPLFLYLPLQAQVELGEATLVREDAPKLMSPLVFGKGQIYSQFVLSRVGGVAFELEALPAAGLDIVELQLSYDNYKPDGNRLILSINEQNLNIDIYDWMLIPIALYAESPYYACFTYFGHLTDVKKEDEIRKKGGKIVNYHPALDNTLLGLRLMQADLLLMFNDCADLPKIGGNYILGKGESAPDLFENSIGFNNILLRIRRIESDLKFSFRSYLISDYNQDIRLSIDNDSLKITGNPFFYCWRYRYDLMSSGEQEQSQKDILDDIDEKLEFLLKKYPDGGYSKRAWYLDHLILELKKYEGNFNIYSSGNIIECLALTGDELRTNYLNKFTTSSLRNMLHNLRYMMALHEPVFLENYSKRLSADQIQIRAMNPAVWDATTATMKYSAFFRYVKLHFPNIWRQFLQQIKNVKVRPVVETPTVMWPSTGVK